MRDFTPTGRWLETKLAEMVSGPFCKSHYGAYYGLVESLRTWSVSALSSTMLLD